MEYDIFVQRNSEFGWDWSLYRGRKRAADGWAFTRRGAMSAAKRRARKRERQNNSQDRRTIKIS